MRVQDVMTEGDRLHDAEEDFRRDVEDQQRRWQCRVRRVWFDTEIRETHRRLRQGIPAYVLKGNVLSLLTAPVIYSLLLPFAILHVWVMLYQSICFPIYGISRVPRRRYFALDRHKLAYLNGIEKMNCTFCSYANGVLAHVREVAARTEQYWCPIKHARAMPTPHERYHGFLDYGDAHGYRKELPALRQGLKRPTRDGAHQTRKAGRRVRRAIPTRTAA